MLKRSGLLAVLVGLLALSGCASAGDGDAEPVVGRQGVLARGTFGKSDRVWVLQASVEGDSLCLDFFGISCISIPDGGSLEQATLASWGSGGGEDYSCSFGPLFREVETVTVEFTDGTVLEGRIIPGQGWETNFYVACIEADSRVSEVVLLDADGARLESLN